ncbi:phage virion morphogenesis protein [Halomonas elongata]|uniref:phage virion morphogenesis protein n=1 Tax=Halomonas elongata TaxID=2746 RepID=UPI0038D492DB
MADDLQALEDWVQPLIAQLDRKARRQLARKVALELRRSQRERIKAQRNPDGTPYEPRKPQHRAQQGAIRRRTMFSKIRTAKYLKAKGSAEAAEVGFTGHVARIAAIHQQGRRAMVDRDGPRIRYPKRRLIGYTAEDRERVMESVLQHLDTL